MLSIVVLYYITLQLTLLTKLIYKWQIIFCIIFLPKENSISIKMKVFKHKKSTICKQRFYEEVSTLTNEKTLEIIKSYIDDIKEFQNNPECSYEKKQHIKKALEAYETLFEDAKKGKLDPDVLHENITSFMYMLQ